MGYGSDRSRGGWAYAILLALFLTVTFFAVEQFSRELDNYVPSASKTVSSSANTLIDARAIVDTEELEAREPTQLVANDDWQRYRSNKTTTLAASIEPSAGVRLEAPRIYPESIDEPTHALIASDDPLFPTKIIFQTTSAQRTQDDDSEVPAPAKTSLRPAPPKAWPIPDQLLHDLTQLKESAGARDRSIDGWCNQVIEQLKALGEVQSLADAAAARRLSSLEQACAEIIQANSQASTPSAIHALHLRVALALQRRVAVWTAAHACVSEQQAHYVASHARSVDLQHISESLGAVGQLLTRTGDSEGWKQYLQLDALKQTLQSSEVSSEQVQRVVRLFLSRVSWQRLSEPQREFLASEPIQNLAIDLHPLAMNPINYRQLLIDLETLETSPNHRCSTALANSIETLRFAEHPTQATLAAALNNHYRNANVRVAVSSKMIERLLPQNTVIERPVRDRILGADTRGASQMVTSLNVELIPDPTRWNLKLRLLGDLQSSTRSSQGPATFHNHSHAAVDSARQIQIDTQGFHIDSQATNVTSHDTLRGFDTSFDALPLIGDLMRAVVRQQFDQKRGIAQRIVRQKIATQTNAEFDKQLYSQVTKAEKDIASKVYGPFERLQLQPLIVDLQTTAERLVARYRVANVDQMAANTPRPRAPSDSLVSLQLHESAVNNALGRLELGNGEWSIDELREKISSVLGTELEPNKNERPDIRIRFASQAPITVRFGDNKLHLTLRIAEFTDSQRLDIERFVAEISLKPTVSGMRAEFAQDGLVIEGSRLPQHEKILLIKIFAKIFEANPSFPLVNPDWITNPRLKGLAISQLEIREGWLAVAISEENSPHIVQLRSRQNQSLLR